MGASSWVLRGAFDLGSLNIHTNARKLLTGDFYAFFSLCGGRGSGLGRFQDRLDYSSLATRREGEGGHPRRRTPPQ